MKTYQYFYNEMIRQARAELIEGLACCTVAERHFFKLMYVQYSNLELAFESARRMTKEEFDQGVRQASIDKVVQRMPDDKLDWAMQQVQRTLTERDGGE